LADLHIVGGSRDVAIVAGRVAEAASPGSPTLDASGLIVAPGLIDLQVNGAAGHDLTTSPERLGDVARHLVRHGVTAFLPTIITAPLPAYAAAQGALAAWRQDGGSATPLGLHFEGPMLSPRRPGAHPPEHLRPPSHGLIEGWSPAEGVGMVTLAPELPGATAIVRMLGERGVVVSLGHSEALAVDVAAAVEAGATAVTHLYNALAPLDHHAPGLLACALASRPPLVCGLIADGIHVDPVALALAWRAIGHERCLLVSDAMAALGLPVGARTTLGELPVELTADGVRDARGRLAGSAAGLDVGLRTLAAATGADAESVIACATAVPARLLGLTDRGHLEPGAAGDVVLLTPRLEVVATVIAGRVQPRRATTFTCT
jgi:N-acetylglucosamine-6-phosphate deacetylase